MATDISTIEFLTEQISGTGIITYKKMFGEYIIYFNGKPIFLICDDILYVKCIDAVAEILKDASKGTPYKGAKEHYIIEDVDNKDFMITLAIILEKVTPLPKLKKPKKI